MTTQAQNIPGSGPQSTGGLLAGSAATRAPTVAPATWAAVTVQVTWTLLCSNIRVTPGVLRDARDNALLHLPPDTAPHHAADRAIEATTQFVRVAKRQTPSHRAPTLPLNARWQHSIKRSCSPTAASVLTEHYGNGRDMAQVCSNLQADRLAVDTARNELRETLRDVLAREHQSSNDWDNERLDAVLRRLAVFSPGPCPPMGKVLAGSEQEHLRHCVVCSRARRLIKATTLTVADLILEAPVPWPRTPSHILVLHFHPDARRRRALLERELNAPAFPIGDDLLYVDLDDVDDVHRVLILAAQTGLPTRAHLRGVVVSGPCRWSPRGLLGPLVGEGFVAVRSAEWGVIEGLGELPPPLPPPPSARPVWLVAAALAVALVALLVHLGAPASASASGLSAQFTPARGGMWAEFDVDDTAFVTVVRSSRGRLDIVLASRDPSDKAVFATGDGQYRAHLVADGLLVVASDGAIDNLQTLLTAAASSPAPLADLKQRIVRRNPQATVALQEMSAP